MYSSAEMNSTLSSSILIKYQLASLMIPSNIIALNPIFAIESAKVPPLLLSLIPPVKGLFAPIEIRPALEIPRPARGPLLIINLFSGPKG
ncbi:hypothetical protein ES708_14238 [subsurface metagenome]